MRMATGDCALDDVGDSRCLLGPGGNKDDRRELGGDVYHAASE